MLVTYSCYGASDQFFILKKPVSHAFWQRATVSFVLLPLENLLWTVVPVAISNNNYRLAPSQTGLCACLCRCMPGRSVGWVCRQNSLFLTVSFCFQSGKAQDHNNPAPVTHTHTHTHTFMHRWQPLSSPGLCGYPRGRTHSWTSITSVQKRKSHCTWEIAAHTPHACLTQSLSSISPSLPPTLLPLRDGLPLSFLPLSLPPPLSLTLSLSLSDALLTKSRLLSSELISVIYSLFSYQHCLMWSETSGRWTRRKRERGTTHMRSHTHTHTRSWTHSLIQSLPGAGDKSWLPLD